MEIIKEEGQEKCSQNDKKMDIPSKKNLAILSKIVKKDCCKQSVEDCFVELIQLVNKDKNKEDVYERQDKLPRCCRLAIIELCGLIRTTFGKDRTL